MKKKLLGTKSPEPLLELKMALLRTGVPQFEAARRIGISETRLSRILCGRIEATPSEQSALATLVGGSVERLFASARAAQRNA